MTTLNETELNQLANMRAQADAGQVGYWQIYQWLGDLLQTKGVPAADSSLLWLRGATEANAGRGAMAALIRTYTATQYQIRYGSSMPSDGMQRASDEIAKSLLKDLFGENPDWPRGQMPDINRIAIADATAVSRTLFGSSLGHDESDTAFTKNAAWSGSLLFSLLRSDQTNRLMQGDGTVGQPNAIDTLNDWRDVLFANVAYGKGLQAAFSAYWAGDDNQKDRDFKTLDQTITGYLQSSGDAMSLGSALLNGTPNPTLKAAFKVIGDAGQNKFLDMLMGAVQGKPLLGSTTDANFASKANTFFSAYGATLQTIGASLMPTNAAALTSLAKTDVNARAALAALSVVSVQVSAVVADQFSLYNEATGQGNITDKWLDDRAAFTANYYKKLQGLGGIVPGSQNIRYFDAASKTEVLVGSGSAQRIQYLFGGDAADTLDGQGFADHLYGGGGIDTLDGKGGNDYLQGDAGDDTLNGGEGQDVLFGGEGNDTLDGGAGQDTLKGGAGTDTYILRAGDSGSDTILDADGQGQIKVYGSDGSETILGVGALKKLANGTDAWQSEDKRFTYTTRTETDNSTTLSISGAGVNAVVKNFTSGNLGITLPDSVPSQPTPTTGQQILGDLEPVDPPQYNALGNLVTTGAAAPDRADTLYDSAGADEIIAGGGLDQVYAARGGDDWIKTGAGRDMANGGAGNDLIELGSERDVGFGDAGDDRMYAATWKPLDEVMATWKLQFDKKGAREANSQEVESSLHVQSNATKVIAACAYLTRARPRFFYKTQSNTHCSTLRTRRTASRIRRHAC